MWWPYSIQNKNTAEKRESICFLEAQSDDNNDVNFNKNRTNTYIKATSLQTVWSFASLCNGLYASGCLSLWPRSRFCRCKSVQSSGDKQLWKSHQWKGIVNCSSCRRSPSTLIKLSCLQKATIKVNWESSQAPFHKKESRVVKFKDKLTYLKVKW